MHIIVLENQPTAARGGQHLSLLDVCWGLSQRGHTISLLYEQAGDLQEQYQQFCLQTLLVKGYTIHNKTDIYPLIAEVWRLKWQIPDSKDSVVYINQYHDSLFGSALALAKQIPLVCHLRQAAPPKLPGQWRLGLKGAKRFIAVSAQTKHDWVMKNSLPSEKIDVIYNAINTKVFQPHPNLAQLRQEWQIPVATKVILYVGRIDRAKGLETLIKALALLQQSSDVPTKLLIAGKPVSHQSPEAGMKYKESLKVLLAELGIEKLVVFLGHITNTVPLYQVSDVTVLPSINSEPFGRTIIESMACGTPAIASQVGGIPEILTGELQQQLFAPGNEMALATTLKQMLHWRSQAPQLGKQCREHVLTNFSMDKMVDGIEQVLLNVVK